MSGWDKIGPGLRYLAKLPNYLLNNSLRFCLFILIFFFFLQTHYESGEYIIRQGARGDTFFIISKGKVSRHPLQAMVVILSRNSVPASTFSLPSPRHKCCNTWHLIKLLGTVSVGEEWPEREKIDLVLFYTSSQWTLWGWNLSVNDQRAQFLFFFYFNSIPNNTQRFLC